MPGERGRLRRDPRLASITLLLTVFGTLATFPGWQEEADETGSLRDVKPFPSRHSMWFSALAAGLAALLMFVSVLWQHVASVSTACIVEKVVLGGIVTQVGAAATMFAWLSVATVVIVFMFLSAMIWSIYALDLLTDDE